MGSDRPNLNILQFQQAVNKYVKGLGFRVYENNGVSQYFWQLPLINKSQVQSSGNSTN